MPEPTAEIVFTQGATVNPPSQSATGVTGELVTVSNGGSPGAIRYRYTLVWVPLSSGLTTGIQQDGPLPTWSFTPDVQNGYTVQLDVFDVDNNLVSTDVRMFVVPRTSGRIIPGFSYTPNQINIGGNEFGFAPYLEQWLDFLDSGGGGGGGQSQYNTTITAGVNNAVATNGANYIVMGGNSGPATVTGLNLGGTPPTSGQSRFIPFANASAYPVTLTSFDSRTPVGSGHPSNCQFNVQNSAIDVPTSTSLVIPPYGRGILMIDTAGSPTLYGVVVAGDWQHPWYGSFLKAGVDPTGTAGTAVANTAKIQGLFNAAGLNGVPSQVRAEGPATYATQYPIFLYNEGLSFEMDPNATLVPTAGSFVGPVVAGVPNPATQQVPVTGTESGITYITMGPGGAGGAGILSAFHLGFTPANTVNGWGDGSIATTTSNETIPALNGTVTLPLSAGGAANFVASSNYYWNPAIGYYQISSVNTGANTITITWAGQGFLPQSPTTGATIPSGTPIGALTSGFTVKWQVDPVAAWTSGLGPLVASGGKLGSLASTGAYQLNLYEVGGGTGAQVVITTTAGTTTLSSGASHLLTNGIQNLVEACYDGVGTLYLFINGTLAGSTACTGTIVQSWYEVAMVGGYVAAYPGTNPTNAYFSQNAKLGSGRISWVCEHNASYTAPTGTLGWIPFITSFQMDFGAVSGSQKWGDGSSGVPVSVPQFLGGLPTVTGPGSVNLAKPWVCGFTAPLNAGSSNPLGVPTWIFGSSPTSLFGGPLYLRHVNITNTIGGEGIHLFGNQACTIDQCVIEATNPLTLDNFSYVGPLRDNKLTGLNWQQSGYTACCNVINGSQYIQISGGILEAASGAGWALVTDAYAGFIGDHVWIYAGNRGQMLIGTPGAATTVELRSMFLQDDAGITPGYQVAPVYLMNIASFVWKGGYLVNIDAYDGVPQMVVDHVNSTQLLFEWTEGVGYPELISFISNNGGLPFYVRYSFPEPVVSGASTVTITQGSFSVSFSNTQTPAANTYIQFPSAQPNSTYKIVSVTGSTAMLDKAYGGANATGTSWQSLYTPWQPETGSSGQGPLILENEAINGVTIFNVPRAGSSFTMYVNDAQAKTIEVTDNSPGAGSGGALLTGAFTVVVPPIVGYEQAWVNKTLQTMTVETTTGSGFTIAAGGHARGLFDGSNYVQTGS